jgi:hypothetical protein
MPRATKRPEIDPQTLKFIVGCIAVLLPFVLSALNGGQLPSLSDSFYFVGNPNDIYGPWSHTIFVGCLYAIGAFRSPITGRLRWIYAACMIALWGAMAFLVANAVVPATYMAYPVFWGDHCAPSAPSRSRAWVCPGSSASAWR